MSAINLKLETQVWPALASHAPVDAPSLAKRLLTPISIACVAVLDVLLVVGAFLLAYWLRFAVGLDVEPTLDVERYLYMGAFVGIMTSVLLATRGQYELDYPHSWPNRLYTIVTALATALVLDVAVFFFLGDQTFSRVWFATGWTIAVCALLAWRCVVPGLYARVRAAVAPVSRLLIVGANPLGQELARELAEHFEVVGYVDNGSDLIGAAEFPLLGPIAQLDKLVQIHAIDEIVIALSASRREQVSRLIMRGFHRAVRVKLLPDMCELMPHRFDVLELAGRRYIRFAPVAAVSWIKRAIDVLLVSMLLLAALPLLLLISVAIKLDSPGPIFFRQVRVGKNGHYFSMLKFRSMGVDAERRLEDLRHRNEASGPLFKIRCDPRVTRVGRLLRRWSLDELPQLLNVLIGDMSLVGPRPPIPAEVAEYEDWQLGRLRAMPGLTGLWQVSGRSEVPFHDMVRLDLHYIRNWSLGLDLEILLRTIPAVLSNRGAY